MLSRQESGFNGSESAAYLYGIFSYREITAAGCVCPRHDYTLLVCYREGGGNNIAHTSMTN